MAGKWKGVPVDHKRVLAQLRRFQDECKEQGLGVECEMAAILMSIVERDKNDWADFNPRRFKPHLRKLQRALECDETI
jgi:hypothetical protein